MKVGFIGAGNMGGAILKGLAGKKYDLSVYDIDPAKASAAAEAGAVICGSIGQLVEKSDVIILGVKPDTCKDVLPAVAEAFDHKKILTSIAAGVSISYIEKYLGAESKVLRAMLNTPGMVGEAMTSLSPGRNVLDKDIGQMEAVFGSIGKVCVVPEELIHCVIGVSGSSPAYTYMFIDALAKAAVKNGMDEEQGVFFAAQAVYGAAKMVMETGVDPVTLRENVCSPGGATIEAVKKLQEDGFAQTVARGFQAAFEKSKDMADKYDF